ncbi:hypothetical protein REPUB_Repub12eG0048700 [Reevesia pubescens]
MGNRVNGTFTKHAYDNIVIDLKEKFRRDIEKEKVKNRWKTLKTNFSKCYDLFKQGMSEFSWNPITKLWGAEREVWDRLIEVNFIKTNNLIIILLNNFLFFFMFQLFIFSQNNIYI